MFTRVISRKAASRAIIIMLVLSVLVGLLPALTPAASAATYTPRLTAPGNNNTGNNIYYRRTTVGGLNECVNGSNQNAYPGSAMPNCVGYAWGRAYEITGKRPTLSKGNGNTFWGYSDGYTRGSAPKLGAIACWNGGSLGHVAVVEKIDGDIVTISHSTWSGVYFETKTYNKNSPSTI